jgi:hypothetical protein
MTDIIKKDPSSIVDSFEGWNDDVEGEDRPVGAGLIQGTLAKFSNEATWVTRDEEELPKLEFVAVAVKRVVQRWEDQKPVETIVLEPHQKFPDIQEMNEKIPREEWGEGPDGKPRGPWQAQHILYLLDPETMDTVTFPTGTNGGRRAICELRDKIVWMQKYRGLGAYPVVILSDTFMPTKWGGRQRPHFKIVRWVRLGGEGGEVEALPPPPATPTPAAQPELPLVQEPSLKEELNDDIPTFDEKPKDVKASPPRPTARRDLKKKPAKANVKAPGKKRPTNLLDAG